MRKSKNFLNTNVQFTLSETVMLSKQSVTLKEIGYFKEKKKIGYPACSEKFREQYEGQLLHE